MTEQPFVERVFEHGGGTIICRFFPPTLQAGGEFRCAWTIDWGEGDSRRSAAGIDGVQALLLAMRTAHTELVESDDYKDGTLTFLKERDLGLPPAYTFD